MTAGRICRVVVHPDGALVTRVGRFVPHAGAIVVHPLPLLLDPTSVRVAVSGTAVRGLRVELDVLGDDRGPAPTRLEAWILARDRVAHLDAALASTSEARTLLAGLAPGFADDPQLPVPSPERWLGWLAAEQALSERVAALDTRLRELAREKREAEEALAILNLELRHGSTEAWWRRWEPTRRVTVDVTGTDGVAGTEAVEVELSYRVPGASWSPAYTLDADGPLRTGRFAMRAMVVQATGEDWGGIALALSSAPCERLIDVPELAALRLGARQSPQPAWRELPAGLESLFPADLAPASAPGGSVASMTISTRDELHVTGSAAEGESPFDFEDGPVTLSGPVGQAAPMAPAPSSAPADLPALARSAKGGFGGAARAMAGPIGALSSSSSSAPSRARGAPRPAPPPPEPAELDVAGAWLDYGQLRLASWNTAPGRRGQLHRVTEADVLGEAGLPSEARDRLADRTSEVGQRATRVRNRPLAPHHVLPAPIGGSDVRIDAAGEVDVPSDGRSHSVAVQTWPVELDTTYRTVPRHDPRAFRRVTASLSYGSPLLPGPVDVYVDGRLELTSPWEGSPGQGKIRLGLGAEDRLKVVRNVRYREESAGMFGGSRKLHTVIEVSVASSLARPVRLEILDRVPVPLAGAESTVEVVDATPVAREYPGEPNGPILKGGRVQVLDLPPGGEARATLSFAVTIGSKAEIVGGDRRG